ncbi:leucine-rich repeat-containing protein 15-like [Photinus pyralis]|uniref:leucine-rich repeat-containing protein 15-like n=1 Tax=Photinus pyralis TaxID=7054 RepID=UPI001267823F|nr:leucine-rich repeat-containing protein 15-like [Photinus pyralis]
MWFKSCSDGARPMYPLYGSVNWVCEDITDHFPTSKANINSITCLKCNIPVLDGNFIPSNFRGATFNLSYSHVKKIQEDAFKSFTNTTHKFIFDNNEINYIGKKVFSNFSQLDEINLRNNKISRLVAGVFDKTNVTLLDLSQNHVTDLTSMLNGLKVSMLNLSSNGIKELEVSALDGVVIWTGRQWSPNKQSLDLSNNFLTLIKPNTFKFSKEDNTLRILHLQKNMLTVIENDTFAQLNYLWHLSLERNSISQLYRDSFRGLSSLRVLNIANNLLMDIPYGIFGNTRSLEQLDLSQNRLTTLSRSTFTGLSSLTKLNISHNYFQTIEDSHLLPLGKLSSLDVSDTRLHKFNLKQIMDHHFGLYTLVINDNFWTCSNLLQMYKLINRKRMTFSYPSRYFDVPNLHGVACSRQELDSYDNLSFENFLSIISQDPIIEDIFDDHLTNDSEMSVNTNMMQDVNRLSIMLTIVTVICVILFVFCVVQYLFAFLRYGNFVKSDKFSFLYAQNQDKVELLP